ncbi:flavodoxin family protein [Adlercreutzia equolifaciens]|uniref:flavodoxin family protein n=1 Tax=Adlercreutzia equolifaciens TaxID=446660 RepID=UPI0023AFAF7E|nr:flavodoxin family protein [Adlercreutzia equolifaciens]MDE8702696.1 flavodoxin family protein [Adlercreutzia equolifaciens]
MHRVILAGSPRAAGRSAALADALFNACIDECPEDGVSIVSVASTPVEPCMGCDACRAVSEEPLFTFQEGDPLLPVETVVASEAPFHHCVIDDDMAEVRKHLDAADELIVVAPVYFASVPAQLKALLDRLQPYFWTNLRTYPKRPAVVHVVGEGGDPHGFEPMIGTLRSALSVAGFRIETVLDWVGKIDASGEILADAEEYELAWEEVDDEAAAWEGAEERDAAWEADDAAWPARDADAVWPAGSDGAADAEDDWPDDFAEPWSDEHAVDSGAVRAAGTAGAHRAGGAAGSASEGRATLSLSAAPKVAGKPSDASNSQGGTSKGKDSKAKRAGAGSKRAAGKGDASQGGRSSSRKPSGKSGGPAYGRKNTKKKGNGRGGRR